MKFLDANDGENEDWVMGDVIVASWRSYSDWKLFAERGANMPL